jgi:negative regulator of sigma E activity
MEEPMRKISLYAIAAAVILTGALGVWAASTKTQARIAPTSARIDTMQMMSGAGNLPTEHFADYSLVFN